MKVGSASGTMAPRPSITDIIIVSERSPGDEFEISVIRSTERLLPRVPAKSGNGERDEYSSEVIGTRTPGWFCQGG